MDDQDKHQLLAMAQQLKEQSFQQTDTPEFDYEAKVRFGALIGRAVLTGSEYAVYPAVLL